jgi:hypothetical protein
LWIQKSATIKANYRKFIICTKKQSKTTNKSVPPNSVQIHHERPIEKHSLPKKRSASKKLLTPGKQQKNHFLGCGTLLREFVDQKVTSRAVNMISTVVGQEMRSPISQPENSSQI